MSEFRITAVCIVTDVKERQRRWGQVYRLLMDLPLQRRGTEHEQSMESTEPSVDDVSSAAGE